MELKFKWTAEDIINEGRVTREQINNVRKWLKKQKDFPKLTDEQLTLFLTACDCNEETTKKTIKKNIEIINDGSSFFTNRSITEKSIAQQLQVTQTCVFPNRTDKGEIVIFHRLKETSFWKYDFEPALKSYAMSLFAEIYEKPPTGIIVMFDMEGLSMLHITRARWNHVTLFLKYVNEAIPVKLKEVHVLNVKYIAHKMVELAKPYLNIQILDLVRFHEKTDCMDNFFRQYVPQSNMPKDYGGDLPSVADMHEENIKKLGSLKWFFDAEEKIYFGDKRKK